MQTIFKTGGALLGGFLHCAITALILTQAIILLQGNYGDDAVPGLLFWTFPYAVASAIVGFLLAGLTKQWRWMPRIAVSLLIAFLASLIARQAASMWLWGYWVHDIGIRVELIWSLAGGITLIVMTLLISTLNSPIPQFITNYPHYRWLTIALVYGVCFSSPYVIFWLLVAFGG